MSVKLTRQTVSPALCQPTVLHRQCLLHNDFALDGDTCVQRLQNCTDGLSFSLWHRASYDEELMYSDRYIPRQALISTGTYCTA